MMKKEIREIIRIAVPLLGITAIGFLLPLLQVPLTKIVHFLFVRVYPVLTGIKGEGEMVFPVFVFGLVLYGMANALGFGAFKYEYKDQAFEYMLALPFSPMQILDFKIRPRLMVLVGLTILYEVLSFIFLVPYAAAAGPLFFLFDPVFFPFWIIGLFFSGFFLGFFEQKNWMALVSLLTLMATLWLTLGISRLGIWHAFISGSRWVNGMCFATSLLLILFFLAIAFFRVYWRFDAKEPGIHSARFVIVALPSMVGLLLIGVTFLIIFPKA